MDKLPSDEFMRKKLRIWRTKRRVEGRDQHQERKAWLQAGDVTRAQLVRLVQGSKGLCKYCGRPVKTNCGTQPVGFDHVIPRVKGGRHTILNMVVCCGPCNSIKGRK